MIHRDDIKKLIEQGLPGAEATVRGDDGAHFEADVVCAEFQGLNMVKQHQMVYATLGDRMQSGEIHALALRTYTPQEWASKNA
jgi:acid stress-induced BolA-like protein IbaG/YrbA